MLEDMFAFIVHLLEVFWLAGNPAKGKNKSEKTWDDVKCSTQTINKNRVIVESCK